MTERVVGLSGKTVTVATLDDISGDTPSVPIANNTTAGIVKGGGNVAIAADGKMTASSATTSSFGTVKQASPVADVVVTTVTDIETAAKAVSDLGTTLTELISVLTASGAIAKSDG